LKNLKALPAALIGILFCQHTFSQDLDKSVTISLFTGIINYQGDMNPNSFTFRHSNFTTGLLIRKPINRWITLRAGANIGSIEAADRYNRDYLKPRNLSFFTSIKEAYAGFEFSILDMSTKHFTPYVYGGLAVFHFNPWTYDNNGVKTYLHPLSTEGQGLSQFPKQRPYKLTDVALAFGGGAKFKVSDCINIGIDFSQRKTFTDYLDDLSSMYVDKNILLQAKGPKAVELAYRGDELPGGQQTYPAHGEQRGTPSEMDWYYFFGATIEIKLNCFTDLLGSFGKNNSVASQRCPRNVAYY
jgi:hypothetical protein